MGGGLNVKAINMKPKGVYKSKFLTSPRITNRNA